MDDRYENITKRVLSALNETENNTTDLTINRRVLPCTPDADEWGDKKIIVITFVASVLIIVGTAGNIATYCVFQHSRYQQNIMASMFRYLSILDMLFLWTIVSQVAMFETIGFSLLHSVTPFCYMTMFWSQLLMSLANWMLVVITIARLVHLRYPLTTQTICSKLNYRLVLVATHVYVVGVHGGTMLAIHSRVTDVQYKRARLCFVLVSDQSVLHAVDKTLYFVTNFAGPSLCLIVASILITLQLRKVRIRRARLFSSSIPRASFYYQPDTTVTTPEDNTTTSAPGTQILDLQMGNVSQNNVLIPEDNTTTGALGLQNDLLQIWNLSQNKLLAPEDCHAGRKASLLCNNLHVWNSLQGHVSSNNNSVNLEHFVQDEHKNDSSITVSTVHTTQPPTASVTSDRRSQARSQAAHLDVVEEKSGEDSHISKPRRFRFDSTVGMLPEQTGNRLESRTYTLTRMLLAANAMFLLSNTPFWALSLGFGGNFMKSPSIGCNFRHMVLTLIVLLRYSNNSVNFFFYCAVGSRFRVEFLALFRKYIPLKLCR